MENKKFSDFLKQVLNWEVIIEPNIVVEADQFCEDFVILEWQGILDSIFLDEEWELRRDAPIVYVRDNKTGKIVEFSANISWFICSFVDDYSVLSWDGNHKKDSYF